MKNCFFVFKTTTFASFSSKPRSERKRTKKCQRELSWVKRRVMSWTTPYTFWIYYSTRREELKREFERSNQKLDLNGVNSTCVSVSQSSLLLRVWMIGSRSRSMMRNFKQGLMVRAAGWTHRESLDKVQYLIEQGVSVNQVNALGQVCNFTRASSLRNLALWL